MKILYITKGQPDADLQGLMADQGKQNEVKQMDLAGAQWEALLDEIEGADQVVSWQNTEHK